MASVNAAPEAPRAAPPVPQTAAPAQVAGGSGITGVYNGTYTGGMGWRTLKLALQTADKGPLTGVFTFYLPPTSHDQAYSFILTGKFTLKPMRWQTQAPGYSMVGLAGTFDPRTGTGGGQPHGRDARPL